MPINDALTVVEFKEAARQLDRATMAFLSCVAPLNPPALRNLLCFDGDKFAILLTNFIDTSQYGPYHTAHNDTVK